MTPQERQATLALAGMFVLRMLGIFMVLPLLSLYVTGLPGATPMLIGLAMGIYGLTQAICQIPCGMISDYVDRKAVIAAGILIFIAGSIMAALSDSITSVIIGRALQGVGAVGSATIALVADLTAPDQRSKAMAVIGVGIGLAFSVAMVLGPLLQHWLSVPGIFGLTALLGVLSLLLLYLVVPVPEKRMQHDNLVLTMARLPMVLKNKELLRLNAGIFALHAMLTASFTVIPPLLRDNAGMIISEQWRIYLPILLVAGVCVFPLIHWIEKKRCLKSAILGAIVALAISQGLLWWWHVSIMQIASGLLIFFIGFSFLEAVLPSLIAKVAPVESRGTAMGIYSSLQFLGIFIGGLVGGWLYGRHRIDAVFCFSLFIAIVWFFIAVNMQNERRKVWPEVSIKSF